MRRYEHLKSVDPVSGKVQRRVRGGNGKRFTQLKLVQELPRVIHAEMVDIRERFPFYDDFMKGSSTALGTPESIIKIQLSIVADYIQSH